MEKKQLNIKDGSVALQIKSFDELETIELYKILQLRSEVFVVEQCCVYQDIDDKGQYAIHLLVQEEDELLAYCRILPPTDKNTVLSFGRVLVHPKHRSRGLGMAMSKFCMDYIDEKFGHPRIEIMAQSYLKDFYAQLGFEAYGEEFREDHLPHVNMRRK